MIGREPQIAGNSTLILKVTGDPQEIEPGGVFGRLPDPPRPSGRWWKRPKSEGGRGGDQRDHPADRHGGALGQGPGGPRRDHRLPTLRQADRRLSRCGGEQEFYLASACDKVFLMPTASLDLTGIASYELFLRGTLDKIGAYPDALHVGDYKTAANTFTEKGYTPAHREMAESLNTRSLRAAGSRHRRRPAQVRSRGAALIDHGPVSARGRDPRRARRRPRIRGRDRRQGAARRHDRSSRADDYRRVSPASLGSIAGRGSR